MQEVQGCREAGRGSLAGHGRDTLNTKLTTFRSAGIHAHYTLQLLDSANDVAETLQQ